MVSNNEWEMLTTQGQHFCSGWRGKNASDVTYVHEGQQVETQDTRTIEGQRHYYSTRAQLDEITAIYSFQ